MTRKLVVKLALIALAVLITPLWALSGNVTSAGKLDSLATAHLLAAGGDIRQGNTERIVFLHTNDAHGAIEGFAQISWQATQFRQEYDHVFLVSIGDLFSGNPVVDAYAVEDDLLPGKPMIELMNLVGYDVTVIGNHDFDYGQHTLQERISEAHFPFILANIDATEADIDQPEPFVILETTNGTRVAFLALVQITPDGIPAAHPANLKGLTFDDPLETALDYRYLAAQSDIFVGLTHLGYALDRELASTMNELDLIIGGHSHTKLHSPVYHNGTPIVQAGSDLEHLGVVVMTICDNELTSVEGHLIPLTDIAGTVREVEEEITRFSRQAEQNFGIRLNYLPSRLTNPMELGCLMSDAILHQLPVDFAFHNSGGIRKSQLFGPVTVGDIFTLEPFGNDILTFAMTPKDIRALLRHSYERSGRINLLPAGLSYCVGVNSDNEVIDIELSHLDGNPLDEDKVYLVGLNSYIANTYDFTAKQEGFTTDSRHNDLIVEYIAEVDSNHLATYSGLSRVTVEVRE